MKKTTLLQVTLVALIVFVVYFLFGVEDLLKTPRVKPFQLLPDFSAQYNVDSEVKAALARIKDGQPVPIITSALGGNEHTVTLTFDGLAEPGQIQKLLELLKEHNIKATFFVDGLQTSENPQIVNVIKQDGHSIENYTFAGMTNIQNLPIEKMVIDFCRAQKIIEVNTGVTPVYLKFNDSEYTQELLIVAKACGFAGVVQNEILLDISEINKMGSIDDFVKKFTPGSIVSVKLLPYPENVQLVQEGPSHAWAKDKQPGLWQTNTPISSGKVDVVDAVEKLILSMEKAHITTVPIENISERGISSSVKAILKDAFDAVAGLFTTRTAYAASYPNGNEQEIRVINTTERALSFTFAGLTNGKVVQQMLDQLDDMGIRATFFIFEMEINRYPQIVREIVARGHELGIAINPREEDDYDKTRTNIINAANKLETQFGVKVQLVKQPFGAVAEDTVRAVSSLGYYLIGQSINVIQTKHKDYDAVEKIMPEIFGRFRHSLSRGDIVHFRMDYYTDDNVLGELVHAVKRQKIDNIAYATPFDNPQDNPANDSWYLIRPVGEVLFNEKYTWKYPLAEEDIVEQLRQDGPTFTFDKSTLMREISKRNIGTPTVNIDNRMVGFTREEVKKLDYTGRVRTDDNVVFFTFDDWGTDAAVNKLLYVFKKHNVKCIFYIITRTVETNRNLLRAIAEEGHEIGSHSHMHVPMAVLGPKGKYIGPQNHEEMVEDFTTSFRILRSTVGDMIVDGRPVLVRHFRPPTMAVSREGIRALFNSGFEYVIGGSESSGDYEMPSVAALTKKLRFGIYDMSGHVQKGAIVVMHMSDNSAYTATTMDIFLAANAAKADDDPSKFKVGLLSDYLVDGYDQMAKRK